MSSRQDRLLISPVGPPGVSQSVVWNPEQTHANTLSNGHCLTSKSYEKMIAELTELFIPLTMLSTEGAFEYPNALKLEWRKLSSIQRVYQITAALGRGPDALDVEPGGIAWWKKPQGKTGGHYHSFEICDPSVPHLKPNLHGNHLKVSLIMPLSPQLDLPKTLDTITYNPNIGLIWVDAHFLGGAILDLSLIKMLNEGKITPFDVQKYHMMWRPIIASEWKDAHRLENPYLASTPLTDILEKYLFS